ncbi:hypothetical protein KAH81_09060 [bacterium]|nr:hypothetical protein [bacterium]
MKKITFILGLCIIALFSGCGKRTLPPEESLKVQLLRPVNETQVLDMDQGFDWDAYPGAKKYIFFLWSDDSPETLEYRVPSSVLYPDFSLLNGEYYWQVGVIEGSETCHLSEISSFQLSQRVIQTVPDEIAILNDTRVYLDWYSYPQSNGYAIKVWPEGDPEHPVFEGYEFSSSTTPNIPFFDGLYCWTVGARTEDETEFAHWSDTLNFSVDQYPYRLVDTMSTRGYPRDIYPYGDYLFVGDGSAGLLYCDRTDPLNPVQVGWDEPSGQYENRAIWIDEEINLMVVADYRGNPPILWYNITNPLAPIQENWAGLFARRTQDVDGIRYHDTLFIAFADYDDGGFVYDLHDTTDYFVTPRGSVDPNGFTYGVAFSDSLFFVACGQVGIYIARADNADSIIAHMDTPGEADKMAISGHHCFVADGIAGLTVFDFSDPSDPVIIGRADQQVGNAQDISICGDYCFVSYGSGGTTIYDITDPSNPIPIQNIAGMYSYAIAPEGDILYIADRDWGIMTLTK